MPQNKARVRGFYWILGHFAFDLHHSSLRAERSNLGFLRATLDWLTFGRLRPRRYASCNDEMGQLNAISP
jgi:hypothetical protein